MESDGETELDRQRDRERGIYRWEREGGEGWGKRV